MPSSIPFDHPSLVLGNIVDTSILSRMKKIGSLQAKIDAAQEKLNAHMMLKRSLNMTINELAELGTDVSEINLKIKHADAAISKAAMDYLTARISNEDGIQALREEIAEQDISETMESPLDFGLSKVMRLPLFADSIRLDTQYFSHAGNDESTEAGIEGYVKEATSNVGSKSGELAKAVTQQISRQKKNHSLAGTLIITASCTHRNVALIEPFVLDVDKAIDAWNAVCASDQDKIRTDAASMREVAEGSPSHDGKTLTVLSGVTYGSSFVGMVHILNKEQNDSEAGSPVDDGMKEQLKIGRWLEDESGGFGVNPDVLKNVQKLLSEQEISSHVSFICMGVIPSIASNQLKMSLTSLVRPDPDQISKSLTTLNSLAAADTSTMETGAAEAKTGKRMLTMQNAMMSAVMHELSTIDQNSNKVMDINTLMNAFEDYVNLIKNPGENTGVPINFYLRSITREQIAKQWLNKYFPQKNNSTTTNP